MSADMLLRARQLAQQRQHDQAESLYAEVARHDARNIEARAFLARRALARSQWPQAQALLEECRRLDAANAEVMEGLGICHQAAGDLAQALPLLAEALRLNPQSHIGWLHLGLAQAQRGEERAALQAYQRAMTLAHNGGRWRSRQSTPQWLEEKVRGAVSFLRERRRQAIDAALAPLRASSAPGELERVERCVQIHLGEAASERPDLRQKPKTLYFPGLPAAPYFGREQFAWFAQLEAQTARIRSELERVLAEDRPAFTPFLDFSGGGQVERYLGATGAAAPAWDAFFFYRHGEALAANHQRCPQTAAAIEALPLARIRKHTPEVCFSLLTPGSHILPHHGDTNVRSVVHLPLIVPADCALRVGGEMHAWQEGRCVAFDDTFEHEAWNRSAQLRVVLILDVWNPGLSTMEQAALSRLIPAIGEFDQALQAEPAGRP